MQDIVQSGIIAKWRKKWMHVVNHCAKLRAAYASQANPITILDIQGGLFLFAIGVFFAHIILALEIVRSKIVIPKRTGVLHEFTTEVLPYE